MQSLIAADRSIKNRRARKPHAIETRRRRERRLIINYSRASLSRNNGGDVAPTEYSVRLATRSLIETSRRNDECDFNYCVVRLR